MDQEFLVDRGLRLMNLMSANGLSPRAAIWVYQDEAERWRLWIVPPADVTDKLEFYRRLSEIVASNRDTLSDIDASNVDMVRDDHPAVVALSRLFGVDGGSVAVSSSMLNGFYLPDGIILRTLQNPREVVKV